jgi:hypothetical protein
MKLTTSIIFAGSILLTAGTAVAAPNSNAPGQDRDCLITWGSAADAQAGTDATALSGKYLPKKAAEAQASQSGGKSRVFDYSDSTQTTTSGSQVTIGSNADEQAFCEGPEFNH